LLSVADFCTKRQGFLRPSGRLIQSTVCSCGECSESLAIHVLRAVQLLLGHTKESTVRYLGIEIDDAIKIAEKIEV
jgi:hypothetical protein